MELKGFTTITALMEQIALAKDEIIKIVSTLPDNPRIKRLGTQCFVMRASDLGNNWSAEHHDFKVQYERVIKEIDKTSIRLIPAFFHKAIVDGRIKESNGQYFTFHMDVRKHLSEITGIEIPQLEIKSA